MSTNVRNASRLPITLAVSALVVLGLLFFPSAALGVNVTGALSGTTFTLGQMIPGTITIDVADDEFIGEQTTTGTGSTTVTVDITGPQGVSFTLPVNPGAFSVGVNGSTISGDITHTNVQSGDFTGYGYGYKGLSGGGQIVVTFNVDHRILLDPAPLNLPVLPTTKPVIANLNITGSLASQGGPSTGTGPVQIAFPDFSFVGHADHFLVPFNAKARGLDARAGSGGSLAVVGVLFDDAAGSNDIYAEFEVGVDSFSGFPFVFPLTAFTLVGSGLDETHGLSFVDSDTIAVAGGFQADGSDAYVATFDLSGGPPFTSASETGRLNLGPSGANLFDKRPGGVAFRNNKIYVTELQTDPSGQVTVAVLDPSNMASSPTSFETPLGFAGAGGFEGFGEDPNSARFFGVTQAPSGDNVRILEMDAASGSEGAPINTWFPNGLPFGQGVTGLGLLDDPDDAGLQSLMFVITENTREIFVSKLAGLASGPTGGDFSNEPQAVDRNPANGDYIIAVKGDPSRVVVLDETFAELSISEVGGPGSGVEVGGAVYIYDATTPADSEYWISDLLSFPPTVQQVNPATGAFIGSPIALPGFAQEISGLAGRIENGNKVVYAYETFNDTFHRVDTALQQTTASIGVFDQTYNDQFFPPFGATAATIGQVNGVDRLIIGRFNQIFEVNLTTGELVGGWNTPAFEVNGLGAGSVLIGDQGFPNNRILGARLPGETAGEVTTVGAYSLTATVKKAFDSSSTTSSGTAFTKTKLGAVTITVTAPTDGQAFTTTPVSVVGTVDDRTVKTIVISQGLAFGSIVGYSSPSPFTVQADRDQYTTNGLWHFTDQFPDFTGNQVAYYGQGEPGNPNYNTGSGPGGANTGVFLTPEFEVTGADTSVAFDVWYSTEPTPPPDPFGGGFGLNQAFDRKIVKWCPTGGGCQNLFHIVSIVQDPFGGGFFFEPPPGFFPVPPGSTFSVSGETGMFVPRARGLSTPGGTRQLTSVQYPLDSLIGAGKGKIKIVFNAGDDFNQGADEQGLVIDNFEVKGPLTVGTAEAVTNGAFSFSLDIAEGENSTTLLASSTVPGTTQGSATFKTFLDTAVPILTLDAVTSPTKTLSQQLTGTLKESNPSELSISVNGTKVISQKTFVSGATTYSHVVGLSEGSNALVLVLADTSLRKATVTGDIIVDNTVPVIQAAVKAILSASSVRAGDPFFIMVNAADAATGITSVTHSLGGNAATYAPLTDVPSIIVKKHGLVTFGSTTTTTHLVMGVVPAGTSAGTLNVTIDATDGAGNKATTTARLTVVSDLPDRTAYLREGFNFIGFPLVPSTGLLDTLMAQEVTNTSSALQAILPSTPTLDDIVESIFTWSGGPSTGSGAGSFLQFVPGAAADTLSIYQAKMGLLINVATSVTNASGTADVFDTALDPTTGSGSITVPIPMNVAGSFLPTGAGVIPPTKTVVTGFNLWTVHAKDTVSFDNILRGALIPTQRAISALTSTNEVNAVFDSTSPGGIDVVVVQGAEELFPGSTLQPMRAYWTRLADDPNAVVDPQI